MTAACERSYRIGGHTFVTNMSEADRALTAQAMQPFETAQSAESPIFTFACTDEKELIAPAGFLGIFDCGGLVHKVGYNTEGGYRIDICDADGNLCGSLNTDRHGREATVGLATTDPARRKYALTNALMIAYAFATADRDTVLIHASVVSLHGKGYLMIAPSGTGKSTHTALWTKHFEGCELVNDDNPIVRIEDGKAVVYGSPWSGKTPCYRNVCHPVGGYVRLYQERKNNIRPLKPLEGYTALLSAVSCMVWDKRMQTGVSATVAGMVEKSTVFRLGCRPDGAAARLCHKAVTKAS